MVRATFAGFSTALSAIQANQKRLDIVGQNLANMNTTGYTRQALETSSLNYTTPVSNYMNGSEIIVGFGVSMDKVTQIRDPYLDVQYRDQMQKAGYSESLQTSLDRLSKLLDESTINGIHSAFTDIQSTLLNMQDIPKVNVPIYETELRTRMQALTNLLNQTDTKITEAERLEYISLDGESTTQNGAVQTVNDILMKIGNLNRQIKQNQILGQQSLEMMDERNVLLDELASYIPIEVTYYKDELHDGVNDDPDVAKAELYHLDSNGNPMFKKEWPDDLRVKMIYTDENGDTGYITLIEGTEGHGDDNYGQLGIDGNPTKPTDFTLTFQACNGAWDKDTTKLELKSDSMRSNGPQLGSTPASGGSIQASLDMLWKTGTGVGNDDVKGYEYYRNELDTLARAFADVMNSINTTNSGDNTQFLLSDKDGVWTPNGNITAANISINKQWTNGNVHISTNGDSSNDTILDMWEAMASTYPQKGGNIKNAVITDTYPNLKDNSFADYMNHVSTTLANDSYNNTNTLKTNVLILNAVQDSRDSMSGVSMNEEASNMMMYQAAYNAASRLMTALDEVLNTLINSTGVCGR